MTKTLSLVAVAVLSAIATQAFGQNEGFRPVTSDMLANPADDHSLLVFDEKIRGKTDRFVFKFRKPR